MHQTAAQLLHQWHDFYILVGTAGATLVGLMFVAASIGARVFNASRGEGLAAFISPTVAHFSAVFFFCVLAIMPAQSFAVPAVLFALVGLFGLCYSGRLLFVFLVRRRFAIDMVDQLFYSLTPPAGYLLAIVAAVMLFMEREASLAVFAAALIVLLIAGIRNAWDMTVWVLTRPESASSAT
jgi:hypothetical protein